MLRPTNIRRYVTLMQTRGFSVEQVLKGTGIGADQLLDPAFLVSLEQCQAVILNMVRLTGDQCLGLALGQQTRLTDHGIVGHAVMSAKSLRQAIGLWLQYSNSLLGLLLAVDLCDEDDGWTLTVSKLTPGNSVFVFCVEEFFAMGLAIGLALSEKPFAVKQVSFAYPAPAHKAEYSKFFDCPISFDAATTSITISNPLLDQALRSNDEEFVEVCLRHCNEVMIQLGEGSSLISRLRSIFLRNASSLPDIREAARQLGMSDRTLRRRLKDENSHYQKLLNEFRFDLAREYLSSGQMAPKEVGYLLGFKFPSTFGRAFKSWTGQSVRRYQRSVTSMTGHNGQPSTVSINKQSHRQNQTTVVLPYLNKAGDTASSTTQANNKRGDI